MATLENYNQIYFISVEVSDEFVLKGYEEGLRNIQLKS